MSSEADVRVEELTLDQILTYMFNVLSQDKEECCTMTTYVFREGLNIGMYTYIVVCIYVIML